MEWKLFDKGIVAIIYMSFVILDVWQLAGDGVMGFGGTGVGGKIRGNRHEDLSNLLTYGARRPF